MSDTKKPNTKNQKAAMKAGLKAIRANAKKASEVKTSTNPTGKSTAKPKTPAKPASGDVIKTNMNNHVGSILEGAAAERRFDEIARQRGNTIFEASHTENRRDHIDFHIVTPGGKKFSVDVKGIKRPKRGGKPSADIQWVEFLNVGGNKGWLYGSATHIAFEHINCFYIFNREELAAFINSKITLEQQHNPLDMPSGNRDFYTPYRRVRYGRKDSVAIIKTQDFLDNVGFMTWEK